ncbi:Piso0_002075 [Millerozyma farinosa CBS 7064]|uniref:Piso0_002075 protein n=1 Tax=Pichia sorbitophila (strain ATCC MYA-4447 / BCRC 22081 / CBS 7064 / NBRC 10061 / NRRL Y-12695) TaxID=559304 RepID=G8YBM1_PICSO|nr:Piso0_002075 [Millerozyma farinosa CBS 7064]
MSDLNDLENKGSNDASEIDTSSFSSILAGVKRMRDDFEVQEDIPESIPEETRASSNSDDGYRKQNSDAHDPMKTEQNKSTSSKEGIRKESKPKGTLRHQVTSVQTFSNILVSKTQKGNPLLTNSLMKSTSWSYDGSILSDYYINPTLQILFLSLKYHKLHPEYVWQRLKKINKGAANSSSRNDRALRLLLVVVDVEAHQELLRKLSGFCVKNDLSLVLSWSFEEAGNYIVFAKKYELSASKVDSVIRGIKGQSYQACVTEALTTVPAINKTDTVKLLANCHSVKNIVVRSSSRDEEAEKLTNIQGIGMRKIESLRKVFTEPFIYNKEYEN